MIGPLLCALLWTSGSDPAGKVDWDTLLASARTDPQVASARSQLKELRGTDGTLLWDKLGAKWSLKRGDFREVEYDIRISPTAWGERRANSATWDARRSLGSAQADLALSEAILDRLQTGLEWIEETREAAYHQALCEVYDARLQTMGKLVGDARFDPRDLVATQLLRTESAAEVVADLSGKDALERRLQAFSSASGSIALDTHLVSLVRVQAVVDTLGLELSESSPDLHVAGRKLEVAAGVNEVERARSSRWLDYIQVGWTWEDTAYVSNRNRASSNWRTVSAEVGLVLPFFDGSSQDRARRQADLAEARGEFLQQRRDLDRKLAVQRMEIASLLRQRAVLDSLSSKVDAGALFGAYAMKSGGDPLLLLQAKATTLETSWRSEKLRFQILDRYLNILHMTGRLVRGGNPLVGN